MWREVISQDLEEFTTTESACSAIAIWINRPHLVNRRLCGTEEFLSGCCADVLREAAELDNLGSFPKELNAFLASFGLPEDAASGNSELKIRIRSLIPRSTHFQETIEAVIEGESNSRHPEFLFFSAALEDVHSVEKHEGSETVESEIRKTASTECAYRIRCKENEEGEKKTVRLKIDVWSVCPERTSKSEIWLRNVLMPKLISWAKKSPNSDGKAAVERISLRLIPARIYSSIHQRLKAKYFADIVSKWTESTDPKKFVSEDIGIAAYLLALWEIERQATNCTPQTFVDLGCGNGLLVYLLRQEGHPGIGIDVRRRKTWDQFGNDGSLIERTFDPATETLPEFDWLIGNHSDELTPWIPWVASRSSYETRFFLLPCCAFDFNRKFNKPGNESEYQSYFKYIRQVCKETGFVAEEDILRIPSTKRSCFIGRTRNYSPDSEADAERNRQAFLKSRLEVGGKSFVVRSAVETTKNCSSFSQTLKDDIISRIVANLLQADNPCILPTGKRWNQGRTIDLASLAGLLGPETLLSLKSQCGGLQTFIRNHQFIFDVRNGQVKLRNYSEISNPRKKSKQPTKLKEKPCWFFVNHPDGCLLDSKKCLYKHDV